MTQTERVARAELRSRWAPTGATEPEANLGANQLCYRRPLGDLLAARPVVLVTRVNPSSVMA